MTSVLIVGAGVAGIACARRLAQAGIPALVLDKGRGIGGRVATRRANGLQFDHGAQYATARSDAFSAVMRDVVMAGDAALWPGDTAHDRFVGVPGMSSLAKALAQGLAIHQGVQVAAIERAENGWHVWAGDQHRHATHVVVAVPAPQVSGLLGIDHPLVAELCNVQMEPCLTLMAGIKAPAPFVSRQAANEALAWIAQDSSKPGRPKQSQTDGAVAWVAQASPAFSAAHLEDDPKDIAARMLPMVLERLGVDASCVTHAAAHRWRYARVTAALGKPFLRDASGLLYLGGDWCLGPRVEAAWTSGTAIADDLLGQLS